MFGANDEMFHIEYERPLVIKDIRPEHTVEDINGLPAKSNLCEWDLFGSQRLKELNLDYTSFNASWMKKEFIDKVRGGYRVFFLYYLYRKPKGVTLILFSLQ